MHNEDINFTVEPTFDKQETLDIEGWNTVIIDYGIQYISNTSYLQWKVQGTSNVFKIPTRTVYEHHGLKYSEHFELTLTKFREDYIEWAKADFNEECMKKDHSEFQFLIKD